MIVSAPLGVQLKLNYIKKEDILAKGGWHVPGRPIVDDSICTGELPPLASLRPQTGRGQPVGLWNQTDRDLANFTSHPLDPRCPERMQSGSFLIDVIPRKMFARSVLSKSGSWNIGSRW